MCSLHIGSTRKSRIHFLSSELTDVRIYNVTAVLGPWLININSFELS